MAIFLAVVQRKIMRSPGLTAPFVVFFLPLCSNVNDDNGICLLRFFSYPINQYCVDLGTFWYHPSTCGECKRIERCFFNVDDSLLCSSFLAVSCV